MKKAQIFYFALTDEIPKEEKTEWIKNNNIGSIAFEKITPSYRFS